MPELGDYDNCIRALQQYVFRRGIHYNIAHLFPVLEALENPHQGLNKIIHVAGTNGKGSTVAMLASGLRAAGFTVGTYTSPHLLSYRERIMLNGEKISQEDFGTFFKQVTAADLPDLSEFEILTFMALCYFREKGPDFVILETGLGGRLDACNVVTPTLSVITKIDFDHCALLGDTLVKIATEKAGIIKPKIPVIVLDQHSEVMAVFEKEAHQCQSSMQIAKPSELPENMQLTGAYQAENLGLVHCVGRYLSAHHQVSTDLFLSGVMAAKLPARYSKTNCHGQPLILDGAHNEGAIIQLLASLKRDYAQEKFTFMMSVLNTKDLRPVLEQIAPFCERLYYVSDLGSMFYSVDEVKKMGKIPTVSVSINDPLPAPIKGPLIVTGSLHFIGSFMKQHQIR